MVITGLIQGIVTLLLIGGVITESENLTGADVTQREAAKVALFESVDDNQTK